MAAIVPGQSGGSSEVSAFANPSIQNGYYQFVQTTAPTQRSSGVPLVTGDRWYKPIDNGVPGTAGSWIWTGAYWVSGQTFNAMGGLSFIISNYSTTTSSTPNLYAFPINTNGTFNPNIYVVGCSFSYNVVSPVNATNYWWPAVLASKFSAVGGGEATYRVNGLAGDTDPTLRTTVAGVKTNIYKSVEAPISYGETPADFMPTAQVYAYKVGSPGNLRGLAVNLIMRTFHP